MANFLYSNVSDELRSTIGTRKVKHGRESRAHLSGEQDFHKWNVGKTAYAKMHALGNIGDLSFTSLSSSNYKTIKQKLSLNKYETTDEKTGEKTSHPLIINTLRIPDNSELKELYDPADRMVPRVPAITNIVVDNQQRLGSVRIAIIQFTVFSRSQHDRYAELYLKLRNKIAVQWGWSNHTDQTEEMNNDIFLGVVYNFEHKLRPDGGSDCTVWAIQPGATALQAGVKGNFSLDSADESVVLKDGISTPYVPQDHFQFMIEDAAAVSDYIEGKHSTLWTPAGTKDLDIISGANTDLTGIEVRGISRDFKITTTETITLPTGEPGTTVRRVAAFTLDKIGDMSLESWRRPLVVNALKKTFIDITPGFFESTALDIETYERSYYRSYITLYRLVEMINKEILASSFSKITIDKKKSTTQYNPNLFSADPSSIIFPDEKNSTYEVSSVTGSLTPEQQDFEEEEKVLRIGRSFFSDSKNNRFKINELDADIGWIYISNEYLKTIYSELYQIGNASTSRSDEKNLLTSFFNKLFGRISAASAGIYDFSLVVDPDNPLEVVIYDANHTTLESLSSLTSKVDNIVPLELPAIGANSIARHVSLKSEVTGRIAASVYASSIGVTSKKSAMVNAITGVSAGTSATGHATLTKKFKYVLDNAKPAAHINAIFPFINSGVGLPEGGVLAAQYLEQVMLADDNLVQSIYLEKYRTRIQSSLELFPLNLSLTLDGVVGGGPKTKGFKFGNVITTDWLPFSYFTTSDKKDPQRDRLHFIVTRIVQTIRPNDWTTSLETVCRILTHRWFKSNGMTTTAETIVVEGDGLPTRAESNTPERSGGYTSSTDYRAKRAQDIRDAKEAQEAHDNKVTGEAIREVYGN